jgi:hypothetical protein
MKPFFHIITFFFVLLLAACATKDKTHLVQFEGESFIKKTGRLQS